MGCPRRGTRGTWASRGLATRGRRLLDSARHLVMLLHLLPLKRGLRNRGTQKDRTIRSAKGGSRNKKGDRHSKMLCACVFGEPKGRRRGGREQWETGNGGLGIRGSAGYLLQWLAHSLQPSTSSPWYVPRPGVDGAVVSEPRLPVADQGAPAAGETCCSETRRSLSHSGQAATFSPPFTSLSPNPTLRVPGSCVLLCASERRLAKDTSL